MIYLSVSDYAEIKKCSGQYIRKLCLESKINCTYTINNKNKKTYKIPLNALDPTEQREYLKKHRPDQPQLELVVPGENKASGGIDMHPEISDIRTMKSFDQFPDAQKEEINFWAKILNDWDIYTSQTKKQKTILTNEYIAKLRAEHKELKVSQDILYRKRQSLRSGDLTGLVDNRGHAKKGHSSIPDVAWECFLYHYLDQELHSIDKCYEYTKFQMKKDYPDLLPLPSCSAFRRRLNNDVPEPLKILGRKGEKEFRDRCGQHIERTYKNMKSNDYWVADNHTIDVITLSDDGKTHRLYLTAILDARSGIFAGIHVSSAPSSQSTIICLRKAIIKTGTTPLHFYVDNGREFLTHDVGGMGHRSRKSQEDEFDPPPILERLGIKMVNAIVHNAKAKIIERRFLDFKNTVSRLFSTFCGGNINEKPEKLKKILKSGKIPTDAEFTAIIEDLIYHYMNEQQASGVVPSDKGKSRMQVYAENVTELRVVPEDDLRLLLMRSTRKQRIGRLGVHVLVAGEKLNYYNNDLLKLFGQEVYCRYDPENMAKVHVYDLENKYLMTAPSNISTVCEYGCDEEWLSEAIRKTKAYEKLLKQELNDYKKSKYDFDTALDLVLAEAQRNKEQKEYEQNPKIISIVRAGEKPTEEKQAVGQTNLISDLEKMIKNLEKQQQE